VEELPLSVLAGESRQQLLQHYMLQGRPFIIRAAGSSAAAAAAAQPPPAGSVPSPEALLSMLPAGARLSFGGVPYASEYHRGGGLTSLQAFLQGFMGAPGGQAEPFSGPGDTLEAPPLIFDNSILGTVHSPLEAMFRRRRSAIFPGPASLSQLIMGPPRSGSALHFHPAAVNFCLLGVKAWVLVPPAAAAFADSSAEHFWRGARLNLTGRLEVLQGPGDMVFIPGLWGHAVINLADSVALAYESIVM
jgi:hypothetical protein